jgi:hypothetical protein
MLRYHLVVIVLVPAGCQREPAPGTVAEGEYALAVGEGPRDFPGLHNVCRVSDKLLCGGLPEGDQGFAARMAVDCSRCPARFRDVPRP